MANCHPEKVPLRVSKYPFGECTNQIQESPLKKLEGNISVEVADFDIQASDTKATAVFKQHYKAGSLVSNSRKTLELSKENGRWLITKESTGG